MSTLTVSVRYVTLMGHFSSRPAITPFTSPVFSKIQKTWCVPSANFRFGKGSRFFVSAAESTASRLEYTKISIFLRLLRKERDFTMTSVPNRSKLEENLLSLMNDYDFSLSI